MASHIYGIVEKIALWSNRLPCQLDIKLMQGFKLLMLQNASQSGCLSFSTLELKRDLNMKTKFLLHTVLATSALVVGCGGSGGSSSASSSSSAPLAGSFVDAPTKGLLYTASPSGLSGITDANGNYQYQPGDTVTFSIPNGANPIVVGSTKPVAPTGGNAISFVLNMTNGEAAAQVLQTLNHSTSVTSLDVSGLTLDSGNTAILNAYIASDGSQLPANADPTVTTNVTNMLNSIQTAAIFSGSATAATPVSSTFLDTVTVGLQSTMSGLTTGLTIPLPTRVPGKLTFTVAIATGATAPYYLIRYRNIDGTSYVKSSTLDLPTAALHYPVVNYSVPSSGNVMYELYPSYTSGLTTYPGYITTDTVIYDDAYSSVGTYSTAASSAPNTPIEGGSGASVVMDTTFSPATIAGKTITFTALANDGCTSANPYVVTIDGTGSSYTASCGGTAPPTPLHPTGFTIATVPNMPGLLSISYGGSVIRYWGLVNGTSLSSGALVILTPGTATVLGSGHLRAVTAH
jgi:hypothetical protein